MTAKGNPNENSRSNPDFRGPGRSSVCVPGRNLWDWLATQDRHMYDAMHAGRDKLHYDLQMTTTLDRLEAHKGHATND